MPVPALRSPARSAAVEEDGRDRAAGPLDAEFVADDQPQCPLQQPDEHLVTELRAIGGAHGVSAAQVALSWLITYYGETVAAIPGASKPRQAGQNAAAVDLRLNGGELARLDDLSRRWRGAEKGPTLMGHVAASAVVGASRAARTAG